MKKSKDNIQKEDTTAVANKSSRRKRVTAIFLAAGLGAVALGVGVGLAVKDANTYYSVNFFSEFTESIGESYKKGQTVTLKAPNQDGYAFIYWLKDGNIVSYDSEYSFKVTASTAGEYVAVYDEANTVTLCVLDVDNADNNQTFSFALAKSATTISTKDTQGNTINDTTTCGWFTDIDCTTDADFSQILSGMTLYTKHATLGKLSFTSLNASSKTCSVAATDTSIVGSIVLPKAYTAGKTYTVNAIASDGFKLCSLISSVIMTDNITSIGTSAFEECTNLATVKMSKEINSIGASAFEDCSLLSEISLTTNLTIIPDRAFQFCVNLTSVVIPDSVTKLGADSFANCLGLQTVSLGTGLQEIGDKAFYNCSTIQSLTVPENVTKIGGQAFGYCSSISEINYNATSVSAFAEKNGVFSYVGRGTESLTLTIGANVLTIPEYLFNPSNSTGSCPHITTIAFSEDSKCTSIGTYAFYDCIYIKEITIPESITTIGNFAFGNCNAVTSVNYNAVAVKDLTEKNNVFISLGKKAEALVLTIGSQVTKIPAYLFNPANSTSSCPRITTLKFENNSQCVSIGDAAFYDCTYLTTITIPESLVSIGYNAFYSCTGLTSILYNAVELEGNLTTNNKCFDTAGKSTNCVITVGDAVEYIPSYLFYESYVTNVVYGDNCVITTIHPYAFYNCYYLTNITLPESLTSIGYYAFMNCQNVETIYLNAIALENFVTEPDETPEDNGNHVFTRVGEKSSSCVLYVGSKVTLIMASLFNSENSVNSCPFITSVQFAANSKCTTIGEYAFYRCQALNSVTLVEGLTTIGAKAFAQTSLTSIWIPSSVTTISDMICYETTGESECKIYCKATVAPTTGWSENWNLIAESSYADPQYGCSYKDYSSAIAE